MTVVEAGKRGGLKLLETRGRNYFVVLGRKGQAVMRQKYPGMASRWGKLGGRPRKPTLDSIVGEKSKKITKEVADLPRLSLSPPTHYTTTNLRGPCQRKYSVEHT